MPEARGNAAPEPRMPAGAQAAAAGTSLQPSASGLRRAILLHLRRHGPASPDALAASLDASRTGVLQQLRALEGARLVRRTTERHGVGRPRHLYDVTEDAQELFPANYDSLSVGLLAAIEAVGGGDLVEEVFAARRRQMGARIQHELVERTGPEPTLADRVRLVAMLQDEQGYLTESEPLPDGTFRLVEHNCAIYRVARGAPAACDAELALFRDVLGADVVRETHIASGDRCCTYRIGGPPS